MRVERARHGALLGPAVVLTVLALGGCSGDQEPSAAAEPTTSAAGSSASAGGPADEEPVGSTIVPDGGELPDGTYRVEFSDEHLAAHGLDPEGVAGNHGVWTTTLRDGRWSIEQVAPDVIDSFEGVYQVRGDDLYWRFHDTLQVLHLRWRVDADGDLHFTQETQGPADFQFALEWTRSE